MQVLDITCHPDAAFCAAEGAMIPERVSGRLPLSEVCGPCFPGCVAGSGFVTAPVALSGAAFKAQCGLQ